MSYSELREDINNIIKEWHFGTEDVFEDKDLEEMTSDIMRVVNEKRPPIKNQQVKKKEQEHPISKQFKE
jgi:hypothetical protein